ncbi:MAG: ASKHA domain-containing protein [Clostridiales Family XIII bacterium]|nr:ASKHA domain-containing protein [Clostridiales Family XIII bacterium]
MEHYISISIDNPPSGKVVFFPGGRSAEVNADKNLLDLARSLGLNVSAPCDGKGTCGKCKVKILSGAAAPPDSNEEGFLTEAERREGVRLACRVRPEGPMEVRLMLSGGETGHRIESESAIRLSFTPGKGLVRRHSVRLPAPSLHDNRPAAQRICEGTGFDFSPLFVPDIYINAQEALREGRREGEDGEAYCLLSVTELGGRIISVAADEERGAAADGASRGLFGVAADIGTTTVAVAIVDLTTGKEVGAAAAPNAQRRFGEDVISRILHTMEGEGSVEKLRRLIEDQLDSLIIEAAANAEIDTADLAVITIAANTSMLHLFLGVPGLDITKAPFTASFLSVPFLSAGARGIVSCPNAALGIIPSVSSYVGGDITAGILAAGMDKSDETVMLIDIGTNGEIVLGNRHGFASCSCAAGPALEGMNIACGTIAADGAIESVRISDSGASPFEIAVIGGGCPTGICGSGIVDAVAAFADAGIVGATGRFAKRSDFETDAGLARFAPAHDSDEKRVYVWRSADTDAAGVYISQKDIRQVQLAKAAIASAIEVLMAETGTDCDDIARVYIAGGFGKHLRLESLMTIGLIPAEFSGKVTFAGNTALSGAVLALLDEDAFARAEAVRSITKYYELSVYDGYDGLFVKHMNFPAAGSTNFGGSKCAQSSSPAT